MKTFEQIAKSLSAEYSLRTRELLVFREGKIVVRTVVPASDESDFWHGEVIDGVDVDFNLYEVARSLSNLHGRRELCAYPVIDGKTDGGKPIEVPLSVLNTYHCVATTIYGSTRMVCNLVASVEAEEKPEQAFKSGSVADRYLDYFDTEEDAKAFVAQSKNA